MNIKYGRDLEKGDLIGVAYSNYIYLAIFNEFSPKGNPRFWTFFSMRNRRNRENNLQRPLKIYTDYISRPIESRKSSAIVKIPVDFLTDEEDQLDYLEFTSILKQNGKI